MARAEFISLHPNPFAETHQKHGHAEGGKTNALLHSLTERFGLPHYHGEADVHRVQEACLFKDTPEGRLPRFGNNQYLFAPSSAQEKINANGFLLSAQGPVDSTDCFDITAVNDKKIHFHSGIKGDNFAYVLILALTGNKNAQKIVEIAVSNDASLSAQPLETKFTQLGQRVMEARGHHIHTDHEEKHNHGESKHHDETHDTDHNQNHSHHMSHDAAVHAEDHACACGGHHGEHVHEERHDTREHTHTEHINAHHHEHTHPEEVLTQEAAREKRVRSLALVVLTTALTEEPNSEMKTRFEQVSEMKLAGTVDLENQQSLAVRKLNEEYTDAFAASLKDYRATASQAVEETGQHGWNKSINKAIEKALAKLLDSTIQDADLEMDLTNIVRKPIAALRNTQVDKKHTVILLAKAMELLTRPENESRSESEIMTINYARRLKQEKGVTFFRLGTNVGDGPFHVHETPGEEVAGVCSGHAHEADELLDTVTQSIAVTVLGRNKTQLTPAVNTIVTKPRQAVGGFNNAGNYSSAKSSVAPLQTMLQAVAAEHSEKIQLLEQHRHSEKKEQEFSWNKRYSAMMKAVVAKGAGIEDETIDAVVSNTFTAWEDLTIAPTESAKILNKQHEVILTQELTKQRSLNPDIPAKAIVGVLETLHHQPIDQQKKQEFIERFIEDSFYVGKNSLNPKNLSHEALVYIITSALEIVTRPGGPKTEQLTKLEKKLLHAKQVLEEYFDIRMVHFTGRNVNAHAGAYHGEIRMDPSGAFLEVCPDHAEASDKLLQKTEQVIQQKMSPARPSIPLNTIKPQRLPERPRPQASGGYSKPIEQRKPITSEHLSSPKKSLNRPTIRRRATPVLNFPQQPEKPKGVGADMLVTKPKLKKKENTPQKMKVPPPFRVFFYESDTSPGIVTGSYVSTQSPEKADIHVATLRKKAPEVKTTRSAVALVPDISSNIYASTIKIPTTRKSSEASSTIKVVQAQPQYERVTIVKKNEAATNASLGVSHKDFYTGSSKKPNTAANKGRMPSFLSTSKPKASEVRSAMSPDIYQSKLTAIKKTNERNTSSFISRASAAVASFPEASKSARIVQGGVLSAPEADRLAKVIPIRSALSVRQTPERVSEMYPKVTSQMRKLESVPTGGIPPEKAKNASYQAPETAPVTYVTPKAKKKNTSFVVVTPRGGKRMIQETDKVITGANDVEDSVAVSLSSKSSTPESKSPASTDKKPTKTGPKDTLDPRQTADTVDNTIEQVTGEATTQKVHAAFEERAEREIEKKVASELQQVQIQHDMEAVSQKQESQIATSNTKEKVTLHHQEQTRGATEKVTKVRTVAGEERFGVEKIATAATKHTKFKTEVQEDASPVETQSEDKKIQDKGTDEIIQGQQSVQARTIKIPKLTSDRKTANTQTSSMTVQLALDDKYLSMDSFNAKSELQKILNEIAA